VLSLYPNAEIVVVGGFEYGKLQSELWGNFPVRLVCNPTYEKTNVTQSISVGWDACLPGPLLIMHGDLVFNKSALQNLIQPYSTMLVAGDQLESTEVGIGHQDGIVTTLSYALQDKWGQMVYMRPPELELFQTIIRNQRMSSQWFLYETLNRVINNGGQFQVYKPNDLKIVDVDRSKDLEKAQQV
jgi:choline kinase